MDIDKSNIFLSVEFYKNSSATMGREQGVVKVLLCLIKRGHYLEGLTEKFTELCDL